MASITRQPGMSGQKEYSGSVQYIGGYDGPYSGDGDVFLQENQGANGVPPIPMGLEVFERVTKLVAHQVVGNDEGEATYCSLCNPVHLLRKNCRSKPG